MTAVTIRPTFKKDSRPNNGLEAIADELQADKTKLFRIVGTLKYAGASVSEDGEVTPASKFITVEVVFGDDEVLVDGMIDSRRKERGLGIADDIPIPGQLAGQDSLFDFDGADDEEEREVPEASAEELMAERAEAKAAETPEESAAIVDANLRRKGSAGLKPAADPFTPGGEA